MVLLVTAIGVESLPTRTRSWHALPKRTRPLLRIVTALVRQNFSRLQVVEPFGPAAADVRSCVKLLNASASPDGDLVKEVHAYFDLCMYFAQVFETGLINILTALETARSGMPIQATFEKLYQDHERLTFGNLINSLSKHNFLPEAVVREALELKVERDHLAHRFFRDHDLDFMTVGGCHLMIEELEKRRERFSALDKRVSALLTEVFAQRLLGFTPETFQASYDAAMSDMLQRARTKFSSPLDRRQQCPERD
jgi:hypothetical protein